MKLKKTWKNSRNNFRKTKIKAELDKEDDIRYEKGIQ
jgi:hypothetical protein